MKAVAVATAEEALEVLEHSPIDILLTDLKLQQTNGVELLKQLHDVHPEVAVVVLTQYGTIESALEVTRIGAVDYVTKPFRIEELRSRLERVARAVELQQENRLLREQLRTRPGVGGLIGVSMKMQRVYTQGPAVRAGGLFRAGAHADRVRTVRLRQGRVHRRSAGQAGKLPHGGEQRLETIAALAVRLRETVRRLSQEWEARQHPVH